MFYCLTFYFVHCFVLVVILYFIFYLLILIAFRLVCVYQLLIIYCTNPSVGYQFLK